MTISLIVPVYNEESYLVRCLESIAQQTIPFDEVILIDDCSTDGSLGILTSYVWDRADAWKLIPKSANKGVSHSRNLGIRDATSDCIAFLDADDELRRDACEIMKRTIEAIPYENVIQFNHLRMYNGRDRIGMKYREQAGRFTLDDMPVRPLAWFAVWNKIFKRGFLKKNKLKFDTELEWGEDLFFNTQAIIANGGLICEEEGLCIRHFDNKQSLNHLYRDKAHDKALVEKLKSIRDLNPRIIDDLIAEHKQVQERMPR